MLTTRDAIIKYAMEQERASARFYDTWASKVEKPILRVVLTGLARQEEEHLKLLEDVRAGRWSLLPPDAVVESLGLAELAYSVPPSPDMTFGEALVIAMKREKHAFETYLHLAEATADPDLAETFRSLAAQEADHRLRLELEYDAHLFTEGTTAPPVAPGEGEEEEEG